MKKLLLFCVFSPSPVLFMQLPALGRQSVSARLVITRAAERFHIFSLTRSHMQTRRVARNVCFKSGKVKTLTQTLEKHSLPFSKSTHTHSGPH